MPHSFFTCILSDAIKWHDLDFFYHRNHLVLKVFVSLAYSEESREMVFMVMVRFRFGHYIDRVLVNNYNY